MKIVVNSLSGLGDAWNHKHPDNKAHQPKPRKERALRCRKCGEKMEHIAGTNVYVCHGTVEVKAPTDNDPNATKKVPCTGRYIAS